MALHSENPENDYWLSTETHDIMTLATIDWVYA